MSGISAKVRAIVRERDLYTCQRCGTYIGPLTALYSIQHRRNRGMGGTRRAELNLPAWLVLLCGTATTGCHGFVEAHPDEARATGYRLGPGDDATQVPVDTFRGRLLLDNDGNWTEVAA